MNEPDEINERVTRLESEVAVARQDAAAARVLAGGADRDVSAMQAQLRAHTRSLSALRQTQVDQGREMREGFARVGSEIARVEGEMREGFARVGSEIARVEGEMREGFSVLAVGQAQITALLSTQLGKSDESTDG